MNINTAILILEALLDGINYYSGEKCKNIESLLDQDEKNGLREIIIAIQTNSLSSHRKELYIDFQECKKLNPCFSLITISKMAEIISPLTNFPASSIKKIIQEFLISMQILEIKQREHKITILSTEKGKEYGFINSQANSIEGYKTFVVKLSPAAQEFIINNLMNIKTFYDR